MQSKSALNIEYDKLKLIKDIQYIYFIGIGGIGMSALARYFVMIGKQVAGYDKTATSLTSSLEELGIAIHFKDTIEHIPDDFKTKKDATLVVYTPAIPQENTEYNFFLQQGFDVVKRAAVLGRITKDTFTLAVAGTHGKTTTTTILAHLLKECGAKVTAFLGGISENFNSNLVLEGAEVLIVEADEFDRSFLQLHPDISAITSMDADHLDIYGEAAALEQSFKDFAALTSKTLLVKKGLPIDGKTFAIEEASTYEAQNVKAVNGTYIFDLKTPKATIGQLQFTLPGRHNLQNAITAFAIALEYGLPTDQLAKALICFKGVQRRFSYHIKSENLVYIDDYAHHPTEITALHQAIREMHPNKKIAAIFQPHLYSRTQDFATDFAKSLSLFDSLRLLEIYPARELPIKGVTSEWLLEKVTLSDKELIQKADLHKVLQDTNADVIVSIGAGDIGEEVPRIKKALTFKLKTKIA